MFRRTVMFWTAAAASFGVPYGYYNPDVRESVSTYWNKAQSYLPTGSASQGDAPDASIEAGQGLIAAQTSSGMPSINGSALGGSNSQPLAAPIFQEFDHFINFNATPRWIMETWPHVSTTLSDLNLEGMRVPLVSGSRVDDIAGSLTYYFDKDKQLQRITFHGTTGDERRLVSTLTQHYNFESEPTVAGSLYMVKWNGEPVSVFRAEPSPVVNQNLPHTRLKIDLEINRPSRYYSLSPEMAKLVDHDKHAGRWGFQ
ncbi:hypothetical protein DTL21_12715 [Bremerella cremea]|uniref:DUF6690 domain-containing protein n=1 Tax=Blastopirellula marina TaxID=124 RepID=A0A2S8FRB1_9BACT|nr:MULTISPECIES: DUF6690 family protein [Pirellulaceae]PQO34384.1 hypothetical protein C5Y83_12710 [Blastopirellula marina]RCS46880.1 hypothetical protein DTL21_12715 [Bremerella cremea]